MKPTIEILRPAAFAIEYDPRHAVRLADGTVIQTSGWARPRSARIRLGSVIFASEEPQNAGDAETINRMVAALVAIVA